MSKDPTWLQAMDQNSTWEVARRQHTAATNSPESGTDLSMDYDFVSQYKAASTNVGGTAATQGCAGSAPITPCWGDPPLASDWDTCAGVYTVSTDKTASATDPTMWKAASMPGGSSYVSCPANPTM
jgi:hypothetical protein